MTDELFTVSDAANMLNVRPRIISDLFYQRTLDGKRCPLIGGRRLIPKGYLPVIKAAIQERESTEGF